MTSCSLGFNTDIPASSSNAPGTCVSTEQACIGTPKTFQENNPCPPGAPVCCIPALVECTDTVGKCVHTTRCQSTTAPARKCPFFGPDVKCCNGALLFTTTSVRPNVTPAPALGPSTTFAPFLTTTTPSSSSSEATSLSLIDATPASAGGGGGDLNQAAIVGGAVGAVAVAALLLFAVLGALYVRSRRQRRLQERAADYISGRPIAPPSRSVVYAPSSPVSQQFSTGPVSAAGNNTYANIHLTPASADGGSTASSSSLPFAVTGAGTSTSESGRVGMADALSERNATAGTRSSRTRKSTKSHAEPASAPAVPYAQLDPNGERFAKFQSIEN